MGNLILIAGTPGVGKSRVASKLSELLGTPHIDLSQYVLEKGLYTEYDEQRQSYVIDEDRVRSHIYELASKYHELIITTHYPEVIPRELVRIVIVLRLDPEELEKRLIARNWSRRKVLENVIAEILSVCTANAIAEHGEDRVVDIDTTSRSIDEIVDEILDVLSGVKKSTTRIDWLVIKPEDVLDRYLREYERLEEA